MKERGRGKDKETSAKKKEKVKDRKEGKRLEGLKRGVRALWEIRKCQSSHRIVDMVAAISTCGEGDCPGHQGQSKIPEYSNNGAPGGLGGLLSWPL